VTSARLGVADQTMLLFDTPEAPFAVVACVSLDGAPLRDEHGRVQLEPILAMARWNVATHPRNRQIPWPVPLGVGRPVWVDCPTFDVADHYSLETLAEPSEAALMARIAEFMTEPFPPGRPLWHHLLIDGLPDGALVLLVKRHHCMMDGVGGMGGFASNLTLTPDFVMPEPPRPFTAEPPPAAAQLVTDALHDLLAHARAVGRDVVRWLRTPRRSWRRACRMVTNLRVDLRALSDVPPLGLMGPPGPRRVVARTDVPLEELERVGVAFGVTVTDVLIAIAGGSAWQLVRRRGDGARDARLVIACPVSTRSAGDGLLGNRLSYMTVELGSTPADPVARLRAVREATQEAKTRQTAYDLHRLVDLLGFAPPALLRRQIRQVRRRGTPMGVSSLIGPPVPVWLMGARVRSFHGLGPLPLYGGIAVVCVSADGNVGIGVTADPDVVPDLGGFVTGLRAELDGLLEAVADGT